MKKRFKMQRRQDNAEVYIYEAIGEDWWGGVSSKTLKNDLNELGAVKDLIIRINSEGGNLFEGLAMYNHIRAADAQRRIVKIDALAASAASLIAMAGDEIEIAANAWMMVHNPVAAVVGDYREIEEAALFAQRLTINVANSYATRTNNEVDTVREMMDETKWMDAAESVDKGFADVETEQLQVAAALDITKYPNAPQELLRRVDNTMIAAKLASMQRRIDKHGASA